MAVRLFVKPRSPKPNLKEKLSKPPSPPVILCQAELAQLSQPEQSAYLHKSILSNFPYYTALAHYRDLRRRTSEGKKKGTGTMWRKNLRVYFRLTERGLCLLKTGYAKKPKNPV